MGVTKPADQLRAIAAPRELVDWVRNLPAETATRTAWVDAPRADWMPYLAAIRGIAHDDVLRATCRCALEAAGTPDGPEATRVLEVLRTGASSGRAAFAAVDVDLGDLKAAIIAASHSTQPGPRPGWMLWAELVLELARATSRGNVLVGAALAMRLLTSAQDRGKAGGRRAQSDLVARFREQLTLAG